MAAGHSALTELLSTGRERDAVTHVLDLLDAGATVEEVVVDHLGAVQVEAGRRWERNEWSVGQEHVTTAMVETILPLLAARGEPAASKGRLAVVCAQYEWHALPARMLALLLQLRGWDARFIGPSVPPRHLERYLADNPPRALVLSCTVAMHLPGAAVCIEAAHRARVPVLAGGAAFGPDDARARALGADAWAVTAADADARLDQMPLGPPFACANPVDPELTELQARRRQVIDASLSRLLVRFPSLAAADATVLAEYRAGLSGAVSTMEAALLVDDDRVLFEHVRWLVGVAAGRGSPPDLVPAGLAALAAMVGSMPRVQRLLGEAEVEAAGAVAELQRVPVGTGAGTAIPVPLPAPVPADEHDRLAAVRRLRILDTAPEQSFDDLVRLAAKLCDTPMAGLGLVDSDRTWFKSRLGLSLAEQRREHSLCGWTIGQRELFVVADTHEDARFVANPYVTGDPRVRFYAGAPLLSAQDVALGSLFVMDTEPGELGAEQRHDLWALARQASSQLQLRAHALDIDLRGPLSADPARGAEGGAQRELLLRQLLSEGGADRLLRTREVALLFDVSERTVNYWASQGRLSSRQTAGGHRRYAARDVLALLQASSEELADL